MLQAEGYYTAYFGKWHLGKDPVGTAGWNEDFGVTGPETTDDTEVTRRALTFLEQRSSAEQPFALFLSYNNPHDIYRFGRETNPVPKEAMGLPVTWHNKDLSAVPAVQEQFMSQDQGKVIVNAEPPAWERYRELYREKVKLYDDEVGNILAALADNGSSETTLVVATSDHGDMDAQHRLIYKGPFMYEHMMRVPLVVRLPASLQRDKTPHAVDFLSVNVDLVPTLADLAGIAMPRTDGVSLKPFLTGEARPPQREFVIGQYYSKQKWVNPIRMIRKKGYKYNLCRTHGEELYDLENDPSEIVNIALDEKHAKAKADLAAKLERWMRQHDDPFNSQNPTTPDGEALAGRTRVTPTR